MIEERREGTTVSSAGLVTIDGFSLNNQSVMANPSWEE